jgi:PTS system mannitol-specific IIC component
MTTASVPASGTSKARIGVQRFGTYLSGMIMPNIPALIAWGIFTAFFIAKGFTPNADLETIVGPFIHYLLPLLIAYTGGSIVYGIRGGVVASIATMGAIAG